MHETGLITTIVAGLVLAFVLGAIANRLRLPPLVGYLIAGVLVGPYTPGFIADTQLAPQLAEIGVILLMFGVGLHFSMSDLLSVRAVAIPGAIVQIGFATLLGWGLASIMGWPLGGGLVFGLALSVASTVVLLKALGDRRLIDTERGRIAVGWLIVEDLAMVLALVLIPSIASVFGVEAAHSADPFVSLIERLTRTDLPVWGILGVTIVKLAAFVGVMLVVGRRVIPAILHYTAHTGSRELFRLAVLAIALGVAAGASYLFGVSLALGAFFAGMILSESELSQRAANESLPLRDAFAVLFFVSVGMLFDPTIILRDPLPVLATLFIILIGKSVAAFLIVVAFRRPVSTALTISASLAQIGEFSFILAELGVGLNLLPEEGRDLILAGAIISIILNPLIFFIAERMRPRLEARGFKADEPALEPGEDSAIVHDAAEDAPLPTSLSAHSIILGYGRVGRVIADRLKAAGQRFLVVEDADNRVQAAHAAGFEVVVGNAASSAVLGLANVAGARNLLVAIPNVFEAGQATEQARKLNSGLRIVARAHSDEEEEHLKHLGADEVILGEREIALGMVDWIGETSAAAEFEPVAEPEPSIRFAPTENIITSAIPAAVGVAATAPEAALSAPVMVPDVEAVAEAVATPEPEAETSEVVLPPKDEDVEPVAESVAPSDDDIVEAAIEALEAEASVEPVDVEAAIVVDGAASVSVSEDAAPDLLEESAFVDVEPVQDVEAMVEVEPVVDVTPVPDVEPVAELEPVVDPEPVLTVEVPAIEEPKVAVEPPALVVPVEDQKITSPVSPTIGGRREPLFGQLGDDDAAAAVEKASWQWRPVRVEPVFEKPTTEEEPGVPPVVPEKR